MIATMSYPTIVEYQEAIQAPGNVFADPDLRRGLVATNPLDLPLALSAGFALAYRISVDGRTFAVRCFHRPVPDLERRYNQISGYLTRLHSSYFVYFQFQPAGILVGRSRYPIVKMEWVEGETFGAHVRRIAREPSRLDALRHELGELAAFLEKHNIAHGDLQNENIIISNRGIRLIDYDGMFVPGMQSGRGNEAGHKHFQHPQRSPKDFGPRMDRFALICIDVSLLCLSKDAALVDKYSEGGQTLIFTARDFTDPAASERFRVCRSLPGIQAYVDRFAQICSGKIKDVPSLQEFRSGVTSGPIVVSTPPSPIQVYWPPTSSYTGAFPVLDASDFNTVMKNVGSTIELVGRIEDVYTGTVKSGPNVGGLYVFLNFGDWRRECVRVVMWPDVLQSVVNPPDKSWVGKWVTVTGLVEAPYRGRFRGCTYTNVGIRVRRISQIQVIDEKEALWRLNKTSRGPGSEAAHVGGGLKEEGPAWQQGGSPGSSSTVGAVGVAGGAIGNSSSAVGKSRNRAILEGIAVGVNSIATSANAQRKNQAIRDRLRSTQGGLKGSSAGTGKQGAPPSS